MEHVYIIYKTINTVNKKFYIGVHRTKNLDDGYMGCGHYRGRKLREQLNTRLYRAFRKYGDGVFITEVLYRFDNEGDAYNKEKELIDIKDKNCYNDKPGGIGGFHPDTNKGRILTEKERKKLSESAKIRSKLYPLQTELLNDHVKSRIGKTYSEIYGVEKGQEVSRKRSVTLTGRKLSDEHKRKMSENRKGRDCGKCKGRKKVYDVNNNKIIRLFPQQIQQLINQGNIEEKTMSVTKYQKVKYILNHC
jgi:group I intron endonuclease